MSPQKITWQPHTKNFIALLTLEYFLRGLKSSYKENLGFDYKYYKKVRDKGYIAPKYDKQFQDEFKKRMSRDKEFVRNFIASQYIDADNFTNFCSQFKDKDFSHLSCAELKSSLKSFADAFHRASPLLFNVIPVFNLAEDMIRKELESKLSDHSKVEQYLQVLAAPDKETYTGKSQKELLRIASKRSCSRLDIKNFLSLYEWLNVRFGYGMPYTFEEIDERIKDLRKRNPAQSLDLMDKTFEEAQSATRKILKELNLSPAMIEIVNLAKDTAYFRTYRLEIFSLGGYYALDLHKEIARRLGLTLEQLFFQTLEEIYAQLDLRQEVEKRLRGIAYVYEDGNIKIYTEDNIQEAEEKESFDPSKKVFSGISVFKGNARGKAKIISSKSDLSKVNPGDILVADFTTPDFVPAMEKASAIITDLGGLTSHTAVIARELGKPCIVGLKDASKVIKDNDVIYVDADNGIVRKTLGLKMISSGDYKTILIMHMLLDGFDRSQEKIIGFGHKNQVVVFNYGTTRFYMDPKEIVEVGNLVIRTLDKDPLFGQHIISQHLKAGEDLLSLCGSINSMNLGSIKNKDLHPMLGQYVKSFITFSGYHVMPVTLEKEISKKIIAFLSTRVSDVNEVVMTLTTPVKETNMVKEKKDLLKIAASIQNSGLNIRSEPVSRMLDNHTKEYEWMGASHKFSPHKKTYFEERLKGLLEKDAEKELKDLEGKPAKIEMQRNLLLKKLNLPDDIRILVDILRDFTYMRDFKRDTGYKSHYYMEKLWREISLRANLSVEHVKNCTPDELLTFLSEGKLPNKEVLDQRLKYGLLVMLDGKMDVLIGDEARELESLEAEEEVVKDMSEFKGMPACKGKAKGYVKVVLKSDQISKVKKGDILVAVNTEPTMVPAMEKAAAIVTDEGGLTCHAAIVSRELGKPCVIGTKIATKVLKDNDFVEVDAINGIVKKIKTNKKKNR